MSYVVLQLFFGNEFVADDFLQFFDDNGVITQLFLTLILLATHLAPPLFTHAHGVYGCKPGRIFGAIEVGLCQLHYVWNVSI